MGDAADWQTERDIDRQLYPFGIDVLFADPIRDKNREILSEYVWSTKAGEEIKFKDMNLSHLLAVVKMQERAKNKYAAHLRDYYQFRVTTEQSL